MQAQEVLTLCIAVASSAWAVAATVYRPKNIDLTPIEKKLGEIFEKLSGIRESYVKVADCQHKHDKLEERFETAPAKRIIKTRG